MPDSSRVSARPLSSQYVHVSILFRCSCFTARACWVNHNLTCPHAQQAGTCPLGKPACLRHLGSSIVDQSAGDWPQTAGRGPGFDGVVVAGGFSFGWVAGAVAGGGAAAGAVIVSRLGSGGAEYAGSGVAEVVGEDISSAANTGNVSTSGAWVAELQCASVLSETSSVSGPPGFCDLSGGSPCQSVVFSRCLMTRSWPRFRRFSTSPLVAALFQSVKS